MFLINAKLQTMDETLGEIALGFLEIDGDKIVSIGDMEQCPELDKQEHYDMTGYTLYPGFIDSFGTLAMAGERKAGVGPCGRVIDGLVPEGEMFALARQNGVTSMVLSSGSGCLLGEEMAAVKTHGSFAEEMVMDSAAGFAIDFGEEGFLKMEKMARLREMFSAAHLYRERREAGDVSLVLDLEKEACCKLLDGSKQAYIYMREQRDIDFAFALQEEFGISFVALMGAKAPLDIARLQQGQVPIVLTQLICEQGVGQGEANLGQLAEIGLLAAVGTGDGHTPSYRLPLCAALAIREGMGYDAAMAAITIDAAKIAGISHRAGSLTVGKDADIVAFAGDPFSVYARPKMVICGGNWVYTNLRKS